MDTITDDTIMQTCNDENDDATMTPCHEAQTPGLEPVSENEESSCGSFQSTSNLKNANLRKNSLEAKKRVSWDRIHTREFALVVGDHPLCQDGLPVSLDWQHTDITAERILGEALKISERTKSYIFPKRMSYEERRQRLFFVSGLTDDQVKNDEIDLVVRTLQESWDSTGIDLDPSSTVLAFDPTPLADEDVQMMNVWEDEVFQEDFDLDLGDFSDFEWTD